MLDADVLIAGPLEELVGDAVDSGRFAGLIAHVRPFTDAKMWQSLWNCYGLG